MSAGKIKAVFFDYDGVLTLDKTGSVTTCKYLSFVTGIIFDTIMNAYKSFNKELTLGVKSHSDVWNEFCDMLNVKIEKEHLIEAFKSTPINTKMVELAIMLKNKGLLLGIITDNKKDRINYLRKIQGLDNIFDSIVVSSELGFDKHSREIFIKALENLNLSPQMCIFIDNQEGNLVIPREIGMKTILHNDLVNDVELLKNLLDSYEIM